MNVTVERLTDPAILVVDRPLQRLFHDAFAGSPVFPGGFEPMIEDLMVLMKDPKAFFLIGLVDGEPRGLSIALLPSNTLAPVPQIFHFYVGGGLPLRKKLTKATAEVVKSAGYTTLWAVNVTGRPDSVWARMFRLAGTAKPLGGVIALDLRKDT